MTRAPPFINMHAYGAIPFSTAELKRAIGAVLRQDAARCRRGTGVDGASLQPACRCADI